MKTFILWVIVLFGFQYVNGQYCVPTITANGPTDFCEGRSVMLTANPQGAWTEKADFGGIARSNAAGFSIANKGYIGMGGNNAKPNIDFWEYDPLTNTWSQKADFAGDQRLDAVCFSIGNKGYIGTGYGVGSGCHKDFWEYDPLSNTWERKADFPGEARTEATGFSIGRKGYIGLGFSNSANYLDDFWEFNPVENAWKNIAKFEGGGRKNAVAFNISGKGYIVSGRDFNNNYPNDFWEYDPAADSWIKKGNFPGIERERGIGFSILNHGYLGTGIKNNFQNDFWEYSPYTNSWMKIENFPGAPRIWANGFSISDKGYIGLGYGYGGVHNDFWEFNPTGIDPAGYTYKWSTGETTSSITITTSGSYTVTITNSAGCIATSEPVVVYVNHSMLSVNCPGNIIVSPTTLSGTIVNYQTPVITSNCQPVSFEQTAGLKSGAIFPIGTTTNIYIATDASGNYATCSFTVTVKNPYCSKAVGNKKVYVCHKGETICVSENALKTHLDHGDYLGECSINYSKISPKNGSSGIDIYPNPTHGKFTITLNNLKASKGVITIMDSRGSIVEKRILNETLYPASISFNLGNNAHGNYRVKVETKMETFTVPVVLQ
jgi:N-acetylneuraminic acid mutarotase